jgi:hypothetical protein
VIEAFPDRFPLDNPKSANDTHGQIRNQVEQEYSNFKYSHPRIMNGIVSFFRQFEPFAVEAIHPIMSYDEKYNPPQQQAHVDDGAPRKYGTDCFESHGSFPFWRFIWELLDAYLDRHSVRPRRRSRARPRCF